MNIIFSYFYLLFLVTYNKSYYISENQVKLYPEIINSLKKRNYLRNNYKKSNNQTINLYLGYIIRNENYDEDAPEDANLEPEEGGESEDDLIQDPKTPKDEFEPINALSSIITGEACIGSNTPPIPTPPLSCTFLPI